VGHKNAEKSNSFDEDSQEQVAEEKVVLEEGVEEGVEEIKEGGAQEDTISSSNVASDCKKKFATPFLFLAFHVDTRTCFQEKSFQVQEAEQIHSQARYVS